MYYMQHLLCAPNASWINPAERVMSWLSLALQNVSLKRKAMSTELETLLKWKSDLKSVRRATVSNERLKNEFVASMQPVTSLVN